MILTYLEASTGFNDSWQVDWTSVYPQKFHHVVSLANGASHRVKLVPIDIPQVQTRENSSKEVLRSLPKSRVRLDKRRHLPLHAIETEASSKAHRHPTQCLSQPRQFHSLITESFNHLLKYREVLIGEHELNLN